MCHGRVALGEFAVVSVSVGSSITTIARRDESRRPLRRFGPLLGHYGIADELLVRDVLDAEQVRRIVAGLPLDDPEPAALVGPPSAVPDQEEAWRRQKERPSRLPPLPDLLPQE